MSAHRASASERDYFRRVGDLNQKLADGQPPGSLAEMFRRLETLKQRLGALAEPGAGSSTRGDIDSHLAFLERIRSIDHAGRT